MRVNEVERAPSRAYHNPYMIIYMSGTSYGPNMNALPVKIGR